MNVNLRGSGMSKRSLVHSFSGCFVGRKFRMKIVLARDSHPTFGFQESSPSIAEDPHPNCASFHRAEGILHGALTYNQELSE